MSEWTRRKCSGETVRGGPLERRFYVATVCHSSIDIGIDIGSADIAAGAVEDVIKLRTEGYPTCSRPPALAPLIIIVVEGYPVGSRPTRTLSPYVVLIAHS